MIARLEHDVSEVHLVVLLQVDWVAPQRSPARNAHCPKHHSIECAYVYGERVHVQWLSIKSLRSVYKQRSFYGEKRLRKRCEIIATSAFIRTVFTVYKRSKNF